jgi:hypothetical protein
MTREVTDNLYIDLGYFTPEEYYTYEANASAALSTQAEFVCTADGGAIVDFSCAMSSSVTQTAVAVKTVSALAPLGTAFSATMSVEAFRITEVNFVATALLSAVPEINRSTTAALDNIVSLSLQSARIRDTQIALTTSVALTVAAQTIKSSTVALQTSAAQTTQAQRVVVNTAQLNTVVSQTVIVNRITRVVGDPTVNVGGLYGQLAFDSTIKKFGSHSLKFLESNTNQNTPSSNYTSTGSKLFALRGTSTSYYNYGYSETSNGTSWTSGATDIANDAVVSLSRVEYINSRLIAWTSGDETYIYSSTNGGTSWTKNTTGITNNNFINNIIYTGTHYIYVGQNSSGSGRGRILRSTNLTTWTSGSLTIGASTSDTSDIGASTRIVSFNDIAVNGSTIVAVASVNRVDTGAADNNYLIYSTDHGANWTGVTASPISSNLGLLSVAFGNNLWVAVGRNGDIFTASAPNSTWTKRTSGVTATLDNVSYSNGLWIVSAGSNTLLTSTDGVTWTQRNVGFTAGQKTIYFASRWWNGAMSSTDAITWTSNLPTIKSSLPQSAVISFADNADWNSWKTVDFWAYVATPNDANTTNPFIIESTSNDYDYAWQVRLYRTGTALGSAFFYRNTSGTIAGTSTPAGAGNTVPYNQWNHFRIVNDAGTISIYQNGTRIRTVTGHTNSYYDGLGLKLYCIGPTNSVYIDELIISDTALTDPTVTSFTVPTTEYVNNDTTDLLLHFNNTYVDDAVQGARTQSGIAQLNSVVTQTVLGGKSANAQAQLNTAVTQTAQANVVKDFDSGQDITATLSAEPTRIKQFSAQFDTVASQLTAVAKVGNTLVTVNVSSSLSCNANIIADFDSRQDITASLTADNSRIREGDFAGADAVFTVTAVGNVVRNTSANVNAAFTQNTINDRIRDTDFDGADSAFTQTVTAQRSADLDVPLDLAFTQNVDYTRIKQFSTAFDSTATQLTAVAKVGNTLVNMPMTTTLTAVGDVSSGAIVNAESQFTLQATGGLQKSATVAATSTFTVTAQPEVVIVTQAQLNSAFTLSAQAREISSFIVFETVTSNLSVSANVIKATQATLTTQATQNTVNTRTRSFVANLPAISSQLTVGSETNLLQAQLNSAFTLSCVVIEIRIDPDLTYMIPSETRSYSIVEELRDDIVIPESRAYTIVKETRDYSLSMTEETYII